LAVVAVPLVVIELGGQASLVVENFFASQLAEGSVAALGYARRLFTGLVALFALSVARGAFPTLSSLNAISDRPQLGKFVISVTNHFVLLFIPATFLLAFHGELVVRAVFLGGAFTEESVIATSGALAFYSAGFLFAAVEPVLIRTCYAISQPKHVLVSTVSSLLVLAVLSWPLVPTLGVSGIALATSVSCLVRVVYLVAALRRSLGGLGGIAGKRVKRTAIVSTLCCSVAQSTAWCLGSAAAFSAWGQAAVFVCLNALIAAVLLREELRDIAKVVMRQPRRSDSADSRFCPGDTP
jgi:putative peptidoglycan lipid II flippase